MVYLKNFCFLGVLCAFLVSPWARAEDPPWIGLQYSRFEYEEPDVMSEKGQLVGVILSYSGVLTAVFSGRLQASYLSGELDYEGSVFNTQTGETTPATTTTKDDVIEIQVDVGGELMPGFRYYAGLAGRLWRDEILGSTGYRRHTTYYYLPVGFSLTRQTSSGTSYGLEAQYNVWLQGHNKSYLTDVNPSFGDYEFDQNEGMGYSLAAYMVFSPVIIRLSYQHWDVEDSTLQFFPATGGFLVEPENNTNVYALTLGLVF